MSFMGKYGDEDEESLDVARSEDTELDEEAKSLALELDSVSEKSGDKKRRTIVKIKTPRAMRRSTAKVKEPREPKDMASSESSKKKDKHRSSFSLLGKSVPKVEYDTLENEVIKLRAENEKLIAANAHLQRTVDGLVAKFEDKDLIQRMAALLQEEQEV